MIPTIGLIVAAYAVARLLSLPAFLPYPPDGKRNKAAVAAVAVGCCLAAAVIGLMAFGLVKSSADLPTTTDPLIRR